MDFIDKLYKHIINFFKGVIISIAMIIPGVSGGTMALILGIYHKLLSSISNFFKDIKNNIIFLGVIALGGLVGILGFAKIIKFLLDGYHFPTIYLFLGLLIGGLPLLFKESKQGEKSRFDLLYVIGGAVLVLILSNLSGKYVDITNTQGILRWLFFGIAGLFVAVALILPGISTTFFLLALGIYQDVINAINAFDINYLLPICIGTLLGVILTAKILESFLNNKPRQTYLLIIGFVLGSFYEIYPGLPSGLDILWSALALILGAVGILYLTKVTKNKDIS